MNYDKICLKRILDTKKLDLLSRIKPEYIKYGVAKFMVKAIKTYVRKYGVIPSLEVFISELKKVLPTDKQDIYIGYLEGLESTEADISNEVLVESLKSQYVLLEVDDKVEAIVEAASAKDSSEVKKLIAELHTKMNTSEKTPENIVDKVYQPSKIRTIRPFIQSMEDRGMFFGGLTIIGAGTGQGKSVLLLNQLMFSYKVEKLNTCLLNLELGSDETIARMYANATGTHFHEVYGNEKLVAKVEAWKNEYFGEGHIFNMENVRYDTQEIEEIIRQQVSLGVTVFGIDYLQLVDAASHQKEWEALRDLVRVLHTLTLELGIVIISPVQINLDEVDEKDGKVKIKVRGSRELENSSTLFLFIYQTPEEYNNDVARVFTIKARNARRNTYVLQTQFDTMRFEDSGIVL